MYAQASFHKQKAPHSLFPFPLYPKFRKHWKSLSGCRFKSHKLSCCYEYFNSVRTVSQLEPKPNTMGLKSCNIVGDKSGRVFIHKYSIFRPNKLPVADFGYALNHLSKWLVIAVLGTVLICRHDSKALWAASGSVVSSAISAILKKTLNHDRPTSACRSDPGMPSSHAQVIFFTIIFTLVSMFDWLGSNAYTISFGSFALTCGSYLSWLRVRQHFHTINQVVVGAILGTIISLLWFWSWDAVVLEAFISHLWVRITVALGAVTYLVGSIFYVLRHHDA